MPAYIKLPDIDGEVQTDAHEKWIEVQSVSLPIFRTIGEGSKGAQRRQGNTSLGDFVVTKGLDSSSPKLAAAVAQGTHMDEVVVHMLSTLEEGEKLVLEIKLTNAIPSGYSFSGTGDMAVRPFETISFNYTKIEWNYKAYNDDGSEGENFPAMYDTEKAKAS
jgi:type VI secretion system secreted protein Hcp